PLIGVIGIVVLRVRLADQGVGADVDFVAKAHFLFHFSVEGRSQDSNDHEGDAEVDNVAAIATRISVVEVNHGREQIHLALAGNHATSANEFGDNGKDHQRRK